MKPWSTKVACIEHYLKLEGGKDVAGVLHVRTDTRYVKFKFQAWQLDTTEQQPQSSRSHEASESKHDVGRR